MSYVPTPGGVWLSQIIISAGRELVQSPHKENTQDADVQGLGVLSWTMLMMEQLVGDTLCFERRFKPA